MATTDNALLADRENDRIGTAILCHEMCVHGNWRFKSTNAMV